MSSVATEMRSGALGVLSEGAANTPYNTTGTKKGGEGMEAFPHLEDDQNIMILRNPLPPTCLLGCHRNSKKNSEIKI